MTLVLIGLVGGIITGLSPCVLPVLPVVFLGGGAGTEAEPGTVPARRRPYLIVAGLTLSFAVFTLFGSLILSSLHLPDDAIRWAGLVLLVLVGLGLLVPPIGHLLERPFYRFPQRLSNTGGNGFLLGIALGAVFVPCAGPVLAAITVAGATDHIGLRTIGLTLGFAVGTAIPLLAFALAGRGLTRRLGAFRRHQGAFRAVSGVVMIVLAVALTFNLSDVIQRDVPNYTQAVGNSLEKGAAAPAAGTSVSLQDCQTAALYGGSGVENCGAAPAFKGIQQWFNTADGKHDDDEAADRAERSLVAPEGAEPLGDAAARQREGEQRDRGADGEAQGEADRAQADVIGRARHRDGRKHRPGARHEDRAERDAEDEAVAAGAAEALREAVERPLEQVPERRHQQPQPD